MFISHSKYKRVAFFSCVVQNIRFSDKSIKMLIQPAVIIKCAFYYQLTFRSLIIDVFHQPKVFQVLVFKNDTYHWDVT